MQISGFFYFNSKWINHEAKRASIGGGLHRKRSIKLMTIKAFEALADARRRSLWIMYDLIFWVGLSYFLWSIHWTVLKKYDEQGNNRKENRTHFWLLEVKLWLKVSLTLNVAWGCFLFFLGVFFLVGVENLLASRFSFFHKYRQDFLHFSRSRVEQARTWLLSPF